MGRALGELEQTLLYALIAAGPDTPGLTLRREVRRRSGRDLAPGAVYTALGRLEDRGLVASHLVDGGSARGGRPARLYSIRPAGAKELAEAYRHVEAMAEGLTGRLFALAREGGDE